MANIKSAISIGMIFAPVSLQKSTNDISVSFNQLCKDTNERIKYKKYCPGCDKEVSSSDIIKGYEFEPGRYVTITPDELEKIKTKKDKTIHVIQFTKMAEIDSIYYNKNYYVEPAKGAEKAFELLRHTMLNLKVVGIAQTVLGSNENLIALYPTKDGMVAKLLFYHEEIREMPEKPNVKLEKAEIDMAKTLINSMLKPFDITQYHDKYQERLREAIETKIKGQEIVNVDTSASSNIIDIMEAMKSTIEMVKNDKGTA